VFFCGVKFCSDVEVCSTVVVGKLGVVGDELFIGLEELLPLGVRCVLVTYVASPLIVVHVNMGFEYRFHSILLNLVDCEHN